MLRNHKLSETLFHCIVQTHEFEDALEERENCEVTLAVCRPGQAEPDPHAEGAAEQEKLVDCPETARNKVARCRTNVVYHLFKAKHLIQALASHEGLPDDWSNDLPVLLTTVRRLHGQLESTTRLLHLHKGVIEGWHRDLDLLLIWKRRIEAYETLRIVRNTAETNSNEADGPQSKKDYREIQRRLERLLGQGEPYTSQGNLAKRLGCSRGTINKAIRCSAKLTEWMGEVRSGKRSPRASSLTAIVTDKTAQTAESDPSDVLTDEDIDIAMRRLIEEAGPDEKARLNELSEDERRKLVQVFYEQGLDQEPSPLEDDPPGCKPRKVMHYKRL